MLKNKGFHHSAFLSPCPQRPRRENGLGLHSTHLGASVRLHSARQTSGQDPKPQADTSALWSRQRVPCSPGGGAGWAGRQQGRPACSQPGPTDALPRPWGLTHGSVPGTGDPATAMVQLPHTRYLPETTSQPKPLCSAGAVSPLPRPGCRASESSHDPKTA